MSERKQSFVLYHDIREPLELLTDSERGRLLSAILNYSEYGEEPEFTGALQMAFAFIKKALDRDAEAWENKREKRTEAGSKGGKQRAANQANAIFAMQAQANQANQAVPVPVPALVPVPVPASKSVSDIEGMADKPLARARFTRPTLSEVEAYCQERKNGIDARRFCDYYEANGWTQGRGKPIRDWRAAVRTWEGRSDYASRHDSGDGPHVAQADTLPGITRL